MPISLPPDNDTSWGDEVRAAITAVNGYEGHTPASLLSRANHTGTQVSATISDFLESVDDRVAALLTQGTNITLNYNDAAGTLNVATSATVNSTDTALRDRSTHTGTQAISTVAGLQAALDALVVVTVNAQTGSYTLILGDAGKAVEVASATATTVTVPPNSSVAFPVGTVVEVTQLDAGQVTVAAGAGVTLRSASGLKLRTQYSAASLRKRGTDDWLVAGDLTT